MQLRNFNGPSCLISVVSFLSVSDVIITHWVTYIAVSQDNMKAVGIDLLVIGKGWNFAVALGGEPK